MKALGRIALLVLLAASADAATPSRVRIAVMGLFHPNELVVEAVSGQPIVVTAAGGEIKLSAVERSRVFVSRSGRQMLVRMGEKRVVAGDFAFATGQGDAEFVLAVPGKLRRVYRGRLRITAADRELLAVVEMDLETAVASVVAAEMPADTPLEALKAQAVVSRSYLLAGGPRHVGADFCDTTHCQFLRRPPLVASAATRATAETKGIVLTWRDQPFAAMFSRSCGGQTHSLAEIGYPERDYPYFAVECRYCRRSPERWSSALASSDGLHHERERIKAGRTLGWDAVPSTTFSATPTGAGVQLRGVGRGHGVGLCQRGAQGMARDGRDFRAILTHYFPNATVDSSEQFRVRR